MANFNFEDVKSVVDEIALENGITQYSLEVEEEKFTGGNYLSKIVRAKINENNSKSRVINLLLKLTVTSEDGRKQLPAEVFFKTELIAYKVIFPEYHKFQDKYKIPIADQFRAPKFYRGAQEYLKEYVIMEDLSALGYKLYGKQIPLDYDHSYVVLKELANFHAVSFAMAHKDPERFTQLRKQVMSGNNYPDVVFKMFDIINKFIPFVKNEEKRNAIKTFMEEKETFLNSSLDDKGTEPYNVICHGDLWNNNMLFREKGKKIEVIFLDFQLIRYASPWTDIVYNFFQSTERSFRLKYFRELCGLYYDFLSDNLRLYGCDIEKIYPRKIFDSHLSKTIPYGFLFALMGSCILQGEDGEERVLEEWIGDLSDVTLTPSSKLLGRFDGIAEDIIEYRKSNPTK